jgi:type II secretory pathway pseudopilin PulG
VDDAEQKPILLDLGVSTESPLKLEDGAASSSGSRVPSGVLLLVVVLGVAAAVLYAMRLTGSVGKMDAAAKSAEMQIEQALAALRGKPDGAPAEEVAGMETTSQVIARFADDPTAKQVDPDQLSKNPFALRAASGEGATAASADGATVDMAAQLEARKLRDEVGRMQLQTVMHGRVPLAVISGQMVREGDQFGSFRVAAIERMAVVLDSHGNTYRLTMETPKIGKF